MLFWIVAGSLAAAVAALVVRPLLAPPPDGDAAAPDMAIYRDQLRDLDRDLARGTLPPEEAERARLEIARRLLAADRAGPRPMREAPRAASLAGAAGGAAVLVLGSLLLYAAIGAPGAADAPRAPRVAAAEAARAARPSQAEAEARAAAHGLPAPEAPADYLASVEELRQIVPTRPDDLRGWELLALHEARLGRYAEAARAQGRVIALKGEDATAIDHLGLVDRLVAAAGGVLTPEAEAALDRVAALDPESAGMAYYRGLLHVQTGRPDLAFPLWQAVIERSPPDGLHRRLAEGQMADVAWLAGQDWAPPAAPADAPGPTAEQAAAAAAMDPAAREDMIRGMVAGLRERLAAEGGPPEDWSRLVVSLAVLGDREGAAEALTLARVAYGNDPDALARLAEAARAAGVGP